MVKADLLLKDIKLPKEIFGVVASDKLLAQYVYVYLNNLKKGRHQTKTRSMVTGSTRKIYRQKGTGR
ncbi:50S ribosomal protein L4, partial [Candidatus Roizmanbacteria bacterium RIFOXYC2_FULL_41_10]